MERIEVDSSMIASVGYDAQKKTLEVEFNSGKVYQYEDVPEEEYAGLMESDSKGRYMLGCVIDFYSYHEVRRRSRSRN